ncbi:HAD family hydrolase [Adlercreutzia sp. ZJ141]|uniref:HAD family hydrolase n=1 Tax=Adlercreutzia sp. ZJ141 TaxID=2709406 RepID=UPI0013EB3FF6|nr:HAD family hydrolase [Adlercreutzia sp. ZJ141]
MDEKLPFDAYVFDLDGTLLDTIPDLVVLTNTVLRECGYPEHTREEILSYVGNGAFTLIKQAVPPNTSIADTQAALDRWKASYATLGHRLTLPYAGMPEMLHQLKSRGAKLAVLSNKFDAATQSVIAEHFPGVFDVVHGECDEFPRKPDPAGLLRTLQELGVAPSRAAYVGDSAGDMEVARRANTFSIGVAWGYQPTEVLQKAGANIIIEVPADVLTTY